MSKTDLANYILDRAAQGTFDIEELKESGTRELWQAPLMPRQSFCFSPILPALLMGRL